jgi:hypothetical protein
MQTTIAGLDKGLIRKAKRRIKHQVSSGVKQPRVRLEKGESKGIYRFKHYEVEVPFRLDSLNRVYFK